MHIAIQAAIEAACIFLHSDLEHGPGPADKVSGRVWRHADKSIFQLKFHRFGLKPRRAFSRCLKFCANSSECIIIFSRDVRSKLRDEIILA